MLRTEPRPLTVYDYRELPEGPPHYQLIEGDLFMSPAPGRYHQDILRNITFIFFEYLQKKRVGEIYFAPFDVFLTDLNVYQPDMVFVSNTRKAILSDRGAEGAPDLVVEILSPKTAKLDKGVKKEIYSRTGVQELWIVDPDLENIQVYRLAESSDVPVGTFGVKQKFQTPLLPGLKIPVAKIFEQ